LSKLEERMRLAAAILRFLKEGPKRYTTLMRLVLDLQGTPSRFTYLLRWLEERGYVEKTGRKETSAPWRITEKGRKFFEAISN